MYKEYALFVHKQNANTIYSIIAEIFKKRKKKLLFSFNKNVKIYKDEYKININMKDLNSIENNIKNLIEAIFYEIELQDLKVENNRASVEVLNKRIKLTSLEDLSKIVNKINKKEKDNIITLYDESNNAIRKMEALREANLLKDIPSFLDSKKYSHFVINDFVRVKKIKEDLDNYKDIKDELKEKRKNSIIKVPIDTKWSDINIKWINGNDVEITLKNDRSFKKVLDFKELGFYDKKRKKPNMNWEILTTLAKYDGQMSWDALGGSSEKEKYKRINAFQKRISDLSKILKNIFLINDSPFNTFSGDKKYYIKINLEPEGSKDKIKKNSWKDLMSDDEIDKYEEISKKNFIKNPNSEEREFLDDY